MKWNFDIVINVSDENRIKSIKYERITGQTALQALQNFILSFNRILGELHEEELAEQRNKGNNDDIPF
jgi:hypothetical protein